MMNAHFPPFDKSPGTVSARSLYNETQVIAERQERDNDALPSILAAMREVVARLERYAERKASASFPIPLYKSATTATPQHPMAAESIREQDERLAGPEDRL